MQAKNNQSKGHINERRNGNNIYELKQKESTYINKICLQILKKIKLHQLSLS